MIIIVPLPRSMHEEFYHTALDVGSCAIIVSY